MYMYRWQIILTSVGEHFHAESEIDGFEGIVACGVVALEDERQVVGGVGGRRPAERQPLAAVAGAAVVAAAAGHRSVARHIHQEVNDGRWNWEIIELLKILGYIAAIKADTGY